MSEKNERELLQRIKSTYQTILQHKLVGIYVHGSLAFGCFHWNKSDIDFLVVVNEKLTQQEKEALIAELLLLDGECPPKGPEMSVVLESVCNPFVYPTPYELHFSNFHKEAYQKDLTGYCSRMNGVDKDLAAHITVINQVGMTLCGKDICQVFAPVPKECYVDSILYDIQGAEEEIFENPVYFILNLCRILAYLNSNLILSKQQGGEWGLQQLPTEYGALIKNALEAYCTDKEFASVSLETDEMVHAIGILIQNIKKTQKRALHE